MSATGRDMLEDALWKAVDHAILECDLSCSEVVGVLECIKFSLFSEIVRGPEPSDPVEGEKEDEL